MSLDGEPVAPRPWDWRVAECRHMLCDTMTPHRSLPSLIRRALRAATPTAEHLARQLGLSSSALRRYRLGNRTPSPAVLRRFAAYLRTQAAVMVRLADELEAAMQDAAKEEDRHA